MMMDIHKTLSYLHFNKKKKINNSKFTFKLYVVCFAVELVNIDFVFIVYNLSGSHILPEFSYSHLICTNKSATHIKTVENECDIWDN